MSDHAELNTPGGGEREAEPFTGPFTRRGNQIFRGDGQIFCYVLSAAEGDWLLARLAPAVTLTSEERWAVARARSISDTQASGGYNEALDPDDARRLIAIIHRITGAKP